MGQKVHPYSFRLGFITAWKSRWFSDKNFAELLQKDIQLRQAIHTALPNSGISDVEIQRARDQVTVTIHTSKPGIIIGRGAANIDKLKQDLQKRFTEVLDIKVVEIRKPEINAKLVAENIAQQIERRISYRRACKGAIQRARELGALGIKILVSGRLNGAEIARDETFKDGNIPLQTLRADIDYCVHKAVTAYGTIGIKVWIYKGLVFDRTKGEEPKPLSPEAMTLAVEAEAPKPSRTRKKAS